MYEKIHIYICLYTDIARQSGIFREGLVLVWLTNVVNHYWFQSSGSYMRAHIFRRSTSPISYTLFPSCRTWWAKAWPKQPPWRMPLKSVGWMSAKASLPLTRRVEIHPSWKTRFRNITKRWRTRLRTGSRWVVWFTGCQGGSLLTLLAGWKRGTWSNRQFRLLGCGTGCSVESWFWSE